MSPRQAALLDPDLEAGLKRLKLAAVRRMAAEVLQTAKLQRWPPDELLRTFVEAEIAADAADNVVLVGPAGTGKSHILLGLGEAAVVSGRRVRYLPAAGLVELLYGGLADNSVGRVIERLLRHDLVIIDDLGFAPLDDVGSQLLFRFVAAAYEHRSLGLASHWPFELWGRFLPEHTTAVAMLDRLLHHATTVVTSGDSYRMKEARARGGALLPTT